MSTRQSPSPLMNRTSIRDIARSLIRQAYLTDDIVTNINQADQYEKVLAQHFGSLARKELKVRDIDPEEVINILPEDSSIRKRYIEQIIRVAHHLSQRTYIGYYSLMFNYFVRMDTPVKKDFLESLPNYTQEDFIPELYLNKHLNSSERFRLIFQRNREYKSLRRAFQRAMEKPDTPIKFFRNCYDTDLPDVEVEDIYSECYNQVCIEEKYNHSRFFLGASMPTFSAPPYTQLFLDEVLYAQGILMHSFCLLTRDLLISVVKNQINPLTRERYSQFTLEIIWRNFTTELKLVTYAVSKINIPLRLTRSCQRFAQVPGILPYINVPSQLTISS